MTTITSTTLQDVLSFIADKADRDDTDRIFAAARARTKALNAVDAAAVKIGVDVELGGLSPKYLNGLSGTVKGIDGSYASVLLDESSTVTLRYTPRSRFQVPAESQRHLMTGIPLGCCRIPD